jgi:N-acetylglutamate synthase-like GNAT family acetyltransferase
MPFTMRWAEAKDERAIKALVRSAKINPMGIHWQRFLVAEDAGRIIGIGQVKVHGDGSRELASIATVPDWQGEGIATAIIEALLAAEVSAASPLYLTCRSHMEPFYRAFGFRRLERLEEMPVYFRRLMRIGRVLFAVGHLFGNKGGVVMVREGV